MSMLDTLALLGCLGAASVGGVFLAFSSFVMRALAQLPPGQGIAAMQRINIVVLNPLFLGFFVGTALLVAALAVLAWRPWAAPGSPLLLAGAALYLAGCFLVTLRLNVPLNERLARLDPLSAAAADYWAVYLRDWLRWNHLRCVAALAAAICQAVYLAL